MKALARLLLITAAFALLSQSSWAATARNVLVIINDNSAASREIGSYYAAKRRVPLLNIVHIKCPAKESIDLSAYLESIENPVREYLSKTGLKSSIEYLLLTKGIPIRSEHGRSVDGMLMCMDKAFGIAYYTSDSPIPNPYYARSEHFSHKRYGLYLTTRLDGYSVADAKALVDRSLQARRRKGNFLINLAQNRNDSGYGWMNLSMADAHDLIVHKGFKCELADGSVFIGNRSNLMGYFSWGSNDKAFDLKKYRSNRFSPGAIAETAVSTSARTFNRVQGGQSLIADLIESGVTGVKGYVSEPYLNAIANPAILFDRYLSGYDLAESFYMASRTILWKDLVIGDPLCAPYSQKR